MHRISRLLQNLIPLVCLAAVAVSAAGSGEVVEEEIVVDVMPGRGAKFDPAAIETEEARVFQGMLQIAPPSRVHCSVQLRDGRVVLGLTSASRAVLAVFQPGMNALERTMPVDSLREIQSLAEGVVDGAIFVAGPTGIPDELKLLHVRANDGAVIWESGVRGDAVASLAVLPDGSVLVCPREHPFVSRVAPDGGSLIPFGGESRFRTDFGNPAIRKAYWEDLGYEKLGYRGPRVHRGGSAGVVQAPDGALLLLSSVSFRHPGGGPDFDLMLLKFTLDGEVLWATHLLEGLPAESDHRDPILYRCPHSGRIYAACWQHGAFAKNLSVPNGGLFHLSQWFTGDISIGWVGRIDPAAGNVEAATFYFPAKQRAPENGKRFANSLKIHALRTDAAGNVYVAGSTAHKLETTLYAFQPDPLGDSGFVAAFPPSFDRLLYASLITSSNARTQAAAMELIPVGPVVASNVEAKPGLSAPLPFTANAGLRDYLAEDWPGDAAVMLSILPSGGWLLPRTP